MKYEKFEELPVWILTKEIALDLYNILKDIRDYGYKDQICRAAVSAMNNIAEGYERKGNRELVRFLISKGSIAEVRSMLYIGKELKYFSESQFISLLEKSESITKQLVGFINSLKSSPITA